ncbi:Aldose reductase [Eumeta japonica]|uniref:Aldose reductase n=1 Tax=Eumeta variegata TaxID=151549 RepID=A0A4C1UL44_EUMVA|nr:Aldose reductase [Eumeta japonica]
MILLISLLDNFMDGQLFPKVLFASRSLARPLSVHINIRQSVGGRYTMTSRYAIERGLIVIPKSVTRHRIESNFHVFDFKLNSEDLEVISSLECNGRLCAMEELVYQSDYFMRIRVKFFNMRLTGNAPVTPLGLRESMGGGDRLPTDGSPASLPIRLCPTKK